MDSLLTTVTEDLLVCPDCGGTDVEVKAWVDANTNEYRSDTEDGIYCNNCNSDQDKLIFRSEYLKLKEEDNEDEEDD